MRPAPSMNGDFPRFLPVSLRIAGKKLLIVGGGKVAFHKASGLVRFTEEVTVIAPDFLADFDTLPFRRLVKPFDEADLAGIFLA
ncbi:MAG: hypothetical protein LBB27_00695, partial [Tannerellaceae bacterium]|nr:hypothetical protein [Tannerellaceae bacterium]